MQCVSEHFGANHSSISANISAPFTAALIYFSELFDGMQSLQHSSEYFGANHCRIPASISAVITAVFPWAFRRQLLKHVSEHFNGNLWPDFCAICALCAWMLRLCLLQSYAHCCNGSRPLFPKRAARASRLLLQRLQGADFCAICALCAWMLRLCLLQSYAHCCNDSRPLFLKKSCQGLKAASAKAART